MDVVLKGLHLSVGESIAKSTKSLNYKREINTMRLKFLDLTDNGSNIILAVVAATLLVAVDLGFGLISFLRENIGFKLFPDQTPTNILPAVIFCIYSFFGIVGILCASRFDLPSWWHPATDSSQSRQITTRVVLIGVTLVVFNTIVNVANSTKILESSHWLSLITPQTAIGLGLHAAFTEEILFRLFLFPVAAWIAWHFLHSRKDSLIIGAIVSSSLFGLMHGAAFFVAFVLGFPMIYIYYHRGLLPAIIVHFLADGIPFVIIALSV